MKSEEVDDERENGLGFPKKQADLQHERARTSGKEPETTTTDEFSMEYIKALMDVAAADAKNNTVVASVIVAAIVFLVKDSIADLRRIDPACKWVPLTAAALLASAALAFFVYAATVSQVRMNIARTLASADSYNARRLWAGDKDGVKSKFGWIRIVGLVALSIGMAFFMVVVILLLQLHSAA